MRDIFGEDRLIAKEAFAKAVDVTGEVMEIAVARLGYMGGNTIWPNLRRACLVLDSESGKPASESAADHIIGLIAPMSKDPMAMMRFTVWLKEKARG